MKMKKKEKELEKEKKRIEKEKDKDKLEYEIQREKKEKELEKERNKEKERLKIERELEKKIEKDNEKREEHLKYKKELDREKEEKEIMKLKNKEEKQKKREKEKEEREKIKEKEKDERNKIKEKNRREREEKERQKQIEIEQKIKLKEEREKQNQKKREEMEKEKKREKEEREKEKQRLRDERKRYNETFQNSNSSIKIMNRNIGQFNSKSNTQNLFKISAKSRPTQGGGYYQRLTYSNKLYNRKRRHSHKRIQPKNRIPRLDAKKNLGKTTLKIIKPKRYDEDEIDPEPIDFFEKLMKFPRFRAKYGKNYILKVKNNKFLNLNTYLSDKKPRELEHKMGDTKKTNLTISEEDEEEEKNNKNKNIKKVRKLSQIKQKGKMNMDKKMREILGKQYKLLVDDPLNPYGTFWPSNFLKAGYDTGFEYDDFQSGVPVLKLKNLGKHKLPPIKKKGLSFKNENSVYSPNRNKSGQNLYPGTSAKKNIQEEIWDNKTNKTENAKIVNIKLNQKEGDTNIIKGITECNENKI